MSVVSAQDGPPDTGPVVDRGLTDPLDRLLGSRLAGALELVDSRAGVRVDDRGVELRGLLRTREVAWEDVERVVLDNRLDRALTFATRFLPVRRVPVVGDVVRPAFGWLAEQATRRLAPGVRRDAGWVVATFERGGLLQRDVEPTAGAALAALLTPAVSRAVVTHAERLGIPVVRA